MFSSCLLQDRVALVTGASRGIGSAIAIALGSSGAQVIVNYNGSKDRAQEVVDKIVAAGGKADMVCCNISDYAACEQMCSELIKKYGKIDILVNNAGITRDNLIMRMSEADYDDVLNTNLKGAFNTIRHLSKFFVKNRYGKIINISSVSGIMGNAGQANYSASKAGLIGLTKSVARELAKRNICVNAIAPGFVETEMTAAMSPEILSGAAESIPLGRLGCVDDIANAVVFLASSYSDYITGQVLAVDGGMSM